MSSTNKTAELHLSQFIGTDIPSILTDYNGDMQKIDAGVREVKQATAGAVSDLSSVTARVTNAEQDISGLNSAVNGLSTRVIANEDAIAELQSQIHKYQVVKTISPSGTMSIRDYFKTIHDEIADLLNKGHNCANIKLSFSDTDYTRRILDVVNINGVFHTYNLMRGDEQIGVNEGIYSGILSECKNVSTIVRSTEGVINLYLNDNSTEQSTIMYPAKIYLLS